MFIKKVIVNWSSKYDNYYSSLRILFYDQDGNLFESGRTISNTNTKAETDNFIVTSSKVAWSGGKYNPISAISTEVYKDINSASPYYYSNYTGANTFIIEFKTIKPISKIKVCTKMYSKSTPVATLRIIDIKDNEESYIIDDTSNNVGTIHEYDLQVDVYSVNEVGTTETTINSNIQEIQTAKSLNVDYDMPNDTEIRMALSNDNRNTYKIFDGSNWVTIDKNDIVSSGMLPSFVNSLTENDLQSFLNGKNLDAYCTLKTNNEYLSPAIKTMTLSEEKRYDKYKVPVTSITMLLNTTSDSGGRFRFYDENDNLIKSGNLISQTDTRCETDNFIVTCSTTYNNSINSFLPYEAIRTDKGITDIDYGMYKSNNQPYSTFKVEFKSPTIVNKIEWVQTIAGLPDDAGINNTTSVNYTINYIGNGTVTKQSESSGNDSEIIEQTFSPYEGDMKRYYLNEATIQTDINIFSTSAQIMKIVDVDYAEDTDTFVRFAFTNDNSTYQVFKSSSWQTINASDVITNGNTADEIKALTFQDLNQLYNGNGLSILVKMKTNNEEKTPIIRKISVAHAK